MVVNRAGVERPIPGEPMGIGVPRVSPDGRRIAAGVSGGTSASNEVILLDVATGARQRLAESSASVNVSWDRNGQRVLFVSGSAGAREVVARAWDRGSPDVLLTLRDSGMVTYAVSPAPPGGFFAYATNRGSNRDIFVARSDSPGSRTPLVATAANEFHPEVSPDGRWIAYVSDESRANEIYVQPLPGPGPRLQVSIDGGREPVWDSSNTLYYRSNGRIQSATLGGSPLSVVRRESLVTDNNYAFGNFNRVWDVFPGGREFLFVASPQEQSATAVMVVLNWQQMAGPQTTDPRSR
jgi:hypothetical protein